MAEKRAEEVYSRPFPLVKLPVQTFSIDDQELIHCLRPDDPLGDMPEEEVELARVFRDVLRQANDFVSADAGYLLLEDRSVSEGEGELLAVAAFGDMAESWVGERCGATEGVAGRVRTAGEGLICAVPTLFWRIDEHWGEGGKSDASVICLPLRLFHEVVGVLELLRLHGPEFPPREQELLAVFAQTISLSIQSAVEAQRSQEMARRDDLTRLYNDRHLHRTLTDALVRALRTGEDCGLIFLDLDRFKRVNDSRGHLAGSRVLRETGALLRQVLPGPAVAARYGGDEFVVVLPGASRQETFWVAETIRKTIEGNVFLGRLDPNDSTGGVAPGAAPVTGITCSLGIATLDDDVRPLLGSREMDEQSARVEILRVADTRMYRAKDEGRNRTVWNDGDEGDSTSPATFALGKAP